VNNDWGDSGGETATGKHNARGGTTGVEVAERNGGGGSPANHQKKVIPPLRKMQKKEAGEPTSTQLHARRRGKEKKR